MIETAEPDRIVLFGSGARGEMTPESDLDFLIVKADCSTTTTGARIRERLPWNSSMPITDIFVVQPEDIEEYGHEAGSVIGKALQEGRVLYERANETRPAGSRAAPTRGEYQATTDTIRGSSPRVRGKPWVASRCSRLPLVDPRFCRVACKVLKTSGLRPRFCAVPRLVRQLIHDVGRLDRFRRLNRAARIGFIPAAAGFASPLRVRRALPLVDPRFCRVACKVLKTSGLRPRFCAVPRLVRQLIHDVGRLDRFRRLNRRVRAARTGWKLGTGHRSRAPPVRPALAGRPRRLPIRTSALVALCSLWRKSRIRPGPGAIEPVH